MNQPKSSILIIEDEKNIRYIYRKALEEAGYEVLEAATADRAGVLIDAGVYDLILLDIRLQGRDDESGLELLAEMRSKHKLKPVIVITAVGNAQRAVRAIRELKAYNFLEKPINEVKLLREVELAIGHRMMETRLEAFGAVNSLTIIGASRKYGEAMKLADNAATSDAAVLITGETGTGKGVLARYIHQNSKRKAKPFIKFNPATCPENLIESELFGHEPLYNRLYRNMLSRVRLLGCRFGGCHSCSG